MIVEWKGADAASAVPKTAVGKLIDWGSGRARSAAENIRGAGTKVATASKSAASGVRGLKVRVALATGPNV